MTSKAQATLVCIEIAGYPEQRSEHDYQIHFEQVLPGVFGAIETHKPWQANTWSDSIVLAFEHPVPAAQCALAVRDFFRQTNWRAKGLADGLQGKVALHTGAIFVGDGATPGRKGFAGPSVDVACRIAAATTPGEVWSTGECTIPLLTELRAEANEGIVAVPLRDVRVPRCEQRDLYRLRRPSDVASPSSDDVLAEINRELQLQSRALGSESCSIRVLDPASNNRFTYFLSAFGPNSEKIQSDRVPANQGIAGSVIMMGVPRVSNRLAQDSHFDPATARKAGILPVNMLTIPMFDKAHDVVGVVQFVNKTRGDFTQEDVEAGTAFTVKIGPSVREVVKRRTAGSTGAGYYEGVRECTVLFTDLTHYGSFMLDLRSREGLHQGLHLVPRLLNAYLEKVCRLAADHNCWVDKFLGDGAMILANAPLEQPDFAVAGVRLALDITEQVRLLVQQWRDFAFPVDRVKSRVGLATGEVYLKRLGTSDVGWYTAVGPSVNLAWRLLQESDRGTHSILMCPRTYELAASHLRSLGEPASVELRGVGDERVRAYQVR